MITLTNTGSAIKFTFDGNSMYLQDGTIEVPFNSLTLVTDNSGMATFKKSATNDIFISASYDELGMTKSQLETWFKENACSTGGGGGIPSGDVQTMIDQSISGFADNASYDSVSQEIKFYNGNTEVYSVDASDFVIDGMIDDVRIETISGVTYLVIDFNTASGKEDIQIPLTDIFDPSNYYTKTEVDQAISGKVQDVQVGNVSYLAYPASTLQVSNNGSSYTSKAFVGSINGRKILTGSQSQDTNFFSLVETSAITSAITSASTNSEVAGAKAVYDALSGISGGISSGEAQTMIDESISGKADSSTVATLSGEVSDMGEVTARALNDLQANKQDTLSAGTNITISGNVISATGGGGGGNPTVELTQSEYDALVSAGTVSADTYYIITDAPSVDISQYWTSAQTQSAINQATSGKVDTSSIVTAVTSGSTDSQVPSAKCVYDQFGGLKLQQITQADYDALVQAGTVDASTLYIITNVVS